MQAVRRASPLASARRTLDKAVSHRITTGLALRLRHDAQLLARALHDRNGMGTFVALYARLRRQWRDLYMQTLLAAMAQALAAAQQAVQRLIRQRGEPAGEPAPGAEDPFARVPERVMYLPDPWGLTPLQRWERLDTRTYDEVTTQVQRAQHDRQALLLLIGGLVLLPAKAPGLRTALRRIEHEGGQALTTAPEEAARFRTVVREAKHTMEKSGAVSNQMGRTLSQALEKGEDAVMQNAVELSVAERAALRADILVRTVAAQTFGKAVVALAKQSGVEMFQWSLSSSHSRIDVCDEYAEADQGYGEGVYPAEALPPYPAHPHCLCSLEPLFASAKD